MEDRGGEMLYGAASRHNGKTEIKDNISIDSEEFCCRRKQRIEEVVSKK